MAHEVLLIEDDRFIGSLLGVFLPRKGLGLTVAASGEAGLALLEQRPFDLVLLDLGLPEMPGLDVLRQVNDGRPAPPIVVITGDGAGSTEAVEAFRLGAVGVLAKPFQLPVLYAELCRVLGLPPG